MSTAIIPIPGVPQIKPGATCPLFCSKPLIKVGLKDGDILVLCQKIVSKAEGAVIDLRTVSPFHKSRTTRAWSRWCSDCSYEKRRGHGWVCANSGGNPLPTTSLSFTLRPGRLTERSAYFHASLLDTFGRPWRDGLVEFASAVALTRSTTSEEDLQGRELHHTIIAVADELAAAAGLLMEKSAAMPADADACSVSGSRSRRLGSPSCIRILWTPLCSISKTWNTTRHPANVWKKWGWLLNHGRIVTDTVMSDMDKSVALAQTVVEFAHRKRSKASAFHDRL